MSEPHAPHLRYSCGTKEAPHQWTETPRPSRTCLRCGQRYDECGIAWHEANVGRP